MVPDPCHPHANFRVWFFAVDNSPVDVSCGRAEEIEGQVSSTLLFLPPPPPGPSRPGIVGQPLVPTPLRTFSNQRQISIPTQHITRSTSSRQLLWRPIPLLPKPCRASLRILNRLSRVLSLMISRMSSGTALKSFFAAATMDKTASHRTFSSAS